MRYIYDIKYGILQVRENEILLRKRSGGTTQLRTLKGTLVKLTTWNLQTLEVARSLALRSSSGAM